MPPLACQCLSFLGFCLVSGPSGCLPAGRAPGSPEPAGSSVSAPHADRLLCTPLLGGGLGESRAVGISFAVFTKRLKNAIVLPAVQIKTYARRSRWPQHFGRPSTVAGPPASGAGPAAHPRLYRPGSRAVPGLAGSAPVSVPRGVVCGERGPLCFSASCPTSRRFLEEQ